MTTKSKWLGALLAGAITLVGGGVRAQDQQRQQRTPEVTVTVNDLAGNPSEHLGQVRLIGVVAAVSRGQGFVLVDKREYADCGLLRCAFVKLYVTIVPRMLSKTENLLSELQEWCDVENGRRAELSRILGVRRQTVSA